MLSVRGIVFVGGSAIMLVAATGRAVIVDLAVNNSGTINGSLFERSDFRSAGTGVINSFVRISSNNATEQGYNTSGRPVAFDENTSPNFTRDVQLSDLPSRTVGGTNYFEFLLDINQQGANPLLSLDAVQIYTSGAGSQTTSNVASLGTLRYNMDGAGDSFVRMNYNLFSGSGQGDMRMLVPTSLFAGVPQSAYIYLFSRFGDNNANNDGYEEWNLQGGGATQIPLPAAGAMGLAGLVGLVVRRRRTR
jgi:MYXO-CTERM domain-containing protein